MKYKQFIKIENTPPPTPCGSFSFLSVKFLHSPTTCAQETIAMLENFWVVIVLLLHVYFRVEP